MPRIIALLFIHIYISVFDRVLEFTNIIQDGVVERNVPFPLNLVPSSSEYLSITYTQTVSEFFRHSTDGSPFHPVHTSSRAGEGGQRS